MSLEVAPVLSPGSWGEYECKASNNLGHASATTSITGALLCDDRDDHDYRDDHGIMMKKDHCDINSNNYRLGEGSNHNTHSNPGINVVSSGKYIDYSNAVSYYLFFVIGFDK